MPSKVWEMTKVGFAPFRPYPLFRRLAPWPFLRLGCSSADFTPTLDTGARLHDQSKSDNSTDVLEVLFSAVRNLDCRIDTRRIKRLSD